MLMAEVGLLGRLKEWARLVKRDILALYLAGRDPRVPWGAKAMAMATAAYALSPIDLIPDVIPIIGYLDDLIILPVAIAMTVRLIPEAVMAELRADATRRLAANPPRSLAAAAAIVAIWLALAACAGWVFILSSPAKGGGG